jgi:hypothetical protein
MCGGVLVFQQLQINRQDLERIYYREQCRERTHEQREFMTHRLFSLSTFGFLSLLIGYAPGGPMDRNRPPGVTAKTKPQLWLADKKLAFIILNGLSASGMVRTCSRPGGISYSYGARLTGLDLREHDPRGSKGFIGERTVAIA